MTDSDVIRSGSFLRNGKRVYWRLLRGGGYAATLHMRTAGMTWNLMGAVHPSIAATALRQYASDYLRWEKKREKYLKGLKSKRGKK